jgi:voltage-dependent potassium channel beta subunit
MQYRRLGKSGLQVSALSLGTWLTFGKQISDEVAGQLADTAYRAGVNFFDSAEIYARGGAEIVLGNILRQKGWDRTSYVVSSKLFFGLGGDLRPTQKGLSRKHVLEGCHGALQRLQVDYLDLLFCHRPDKQTPIEETVWAMHSLVMQGKVLYWGTSEWSASEVLEACLVAEKHHLIGPTMEQPQYNLFERQKVENEYLPLFERYGIGTTVWSPLASGLLTGKYNDADPKDTRFNIAGLEWLRDATLREERLNAVKALKTVADELGTSLPKLAIAWCLRNPHVSTVILGASKVTQLEETLGALDVVPQLTGEVVNRMEEIVGTKPVLPEY